MSQKYRYRRTTPRSEITAEAVYRSGREFRMGTAASSAAALLAACGAPSGAPEDGTPPPPGAEGQVGTAVPTFTPAPDDLTSEQDILHYNNFYEFTLEKETVAEK